MSAEMLRAAARLMRERARGVEAAAVPTPWRATPDSRNLRHTGRALTVARAYLGEA